MKATFLSFFIVLTSFLYGQNNLPRLINLNDQIIHHKGYTLSYNETHEQANWVSYMVTKVELESKVAKRKDNFKEDTSVITGSASLLDYKGSGYDRGHLAPAATFVDDQKEMDESFYMSNMSPQHPSFNRGVWKRLEEYERKVAMEKDTVYVICGPVLTEGLKTIGPNNVSVPELYFKIIYYKEWRMCFIINNEKSSEPLYVFKQPLDIIEKITMIDFFTE
jgi:endonuclease G, mitochondrial